VQHRVVVRHHLSEKLFDANGVGRRREPLESYPLESLNMVGTLEKEKGSAPNSQMICYGYLSSLPITLIAQATMGFWMN